MVNVVKRVDKSGGIKYGLSMFTVDVEDRFWDFKEFSRNVIVEEEIYRCGVRVLGKVREEQLESCRPEDSRLGGLTVMGDDPESW
ncbi:hypothetical protein JTE90_028791 [Oedothorax gibbosus]|uniref:Uncharacterized protein n=1 Tax=Oedothorax gibbosus TaxID=931172 RepID=A0AAV6VZI9_9ARAC|nr:hypothetical protein JTE90_028791 [Oedothorax gibbosus]